MTPTNLVWIFFRIAVAIILGAVLVDAARLAKPGATHASFPMDAFSKPAFKLIYDENDPVSNQTAIDLLRRCGIDGSKDRSALEAFATEAGGDVGAEQALSQAFLQRTSLEVLHVCTVPKAKPPRQPLQLDEEGLSQHRARILRNALQLLSPLKTTCLYHTLEWFTYSFCYGDAIRQFRALPGTAAAGRTPGIDPQQDSYVLGRWNDGIEVIDGESQDQNKGDASLSKPSASESESRPVTTDAAFTNDGTELMELVRFSNLDNDADTRPQRTAHTSAEQMVDGGDGRYISQIWTHGTLCDVNNEPRTTEVQFHCSTTPSADRVSLIKETTTCNYVLVVETPKLCVEPALVPAEEDIREVRCRPILSDDELVKFNKGGRQQSFTPGPIGFKADGIRAAFQDVFKNAQASHAKLQKAQEGKTEQPQTTRDDTSPPPGESHKKDTVSAKDSNEMEIVIGWDEQGRFIVEPRDNGETVDADDRLTRSSEGATSERSSKWDELLDKLSDLEHEVLDSMEREGIQLEDLFGVEGNILEEAARSPLPDTLAERYAHTAEARETQQTQQETPADAHQHEAAPTPTLPSHEVPQQQQQQQRQPRRDAGGAKPQVIVQRKGNGQEALQQQARGVNQMVKETETFGQRVERHFKAKEDMERKLSEQQRMLQKSHTEEGESEKSEDAEARQDSAAGHEEVARDRAEF